MENEKEIELFRDKSAEIRTRKSVSDLTSAQLEQKKEESDASQNRKYIASSI